MDRTDGLISKLLSSLKEYLGLQKEYAMLELTEKLTRLLTALILGAILFVLAIIAVIFLSLTLVAFLSWLTGSAIISYAIVTGLYVLLGVIIYSMRMKWLATPLTNFFINLLLK
ncbi:MAG: phage holin family protein [Bacteroidaceae bacterium]|jgi:uncharacterized membrane protein YqjE|nr:phage holin family protein [Bacteroidaceae bacterium]